MTRQTVGRVRASCDGVDNFLTRAVVTGGAGTGAVGRNVMFNAVDLGPVGNRVTIATQLTRGVIGEIARTFSNRMGVRTVDAVETGRMTGRAVATGGEVLTHGNADPAAIDVVTA